MTLYGRGVHSRSEPVVSSVVIMNNPVLGETAEITAPNATRDWYTADELQAVEAKRAEDRAFLACYRMRRSARARVRSFLRVDLIENAVNRIVDGFCTSACWVVDFFRRGRNSGNIFLA